MTIVNDQLFTPLLAYVSILNTLTVVRAAERRRELHGARARATVKKYGKIDFEDLFTGDPPSIGAAAYVVGPINFLLRNAFEDVDIEGLNLEIDASEQSKSATLERVWIDGNRPKPGSTVDAEDAAADVSRRGDHALVPVEIPANARGSVSIMVADGTRLSQMEARELQLQPLQTRDLPQMIRVLNQARKNNRLYVRLVTPRRRRRRQGRIALVAAAVRAGGDGIGSQRRQLQAAGRRAARRMGDHRRTTRSAARAR